MCKTHDLHKASNRFMLTLKTKWTYIVSRSLCLQTWHNFFIIKNYKIIAENGIKVPQTTLPYRIRLQLHFAWTVWNPVISITNQRSPILTSSAAYVPSCKKCTDGTELELLPTACLTACLSFLLEMYTSGYLTITQQQIPVSVLNELIKVTTYLLYFTTLNTDLWETDMTLADHKSSNYQIF